MGGLKLEPVNLPLPLTYINTINFLNPTFETQGLYQRMVRSFFKIRKSVKSFLTPPTSPQKTKDKSRLILKKFMSDLNFMKALGIVKISEDIYDPTQREDLKGLNTHPYHQVMPYWDCIRSFFDFHIFYGGHALLPSLSITRKPYAAYEHGTIRGIPLQDNDFGRLIKHAYENANVVMITNADYFNAKKRLEFDAQKIVYIPHGFDDTSCIDFLNKFKKCTDKNNIVKFFAPSRHDWVNGNDGNSKGNEIIVKAAKKLVDDRKANFLVTMLEYGSDVQATKNLIQQLELEAYFEWNPTMSRKELWTFCLNSNAVLDQFYSCNWSNWCGNYCSGSKAY
jgi:hypothetical protein